MLFKPRIKFTDPHLPRDSTEDEKQAIITIEPKLLLADFSNPVDFHARQRLHVRICPRERNTHPKPDKDAKQLDNVGVGDRVETAEQRVEHSDASRENNGLSLLHVDNNCQSRS